MGTLQSAQTKLNGSKNEQMVFRKDPVSYLGALGISLKEDSKSHARTTLMTGETPAPDWHSNIIQGEHDPM